MSWMYGVLLSTSSSREKTAANHTAPIHGNAVCFYCVWLLTSACCRTVLPYSYTVYPVTEPVNANTANTYVSHWTKMVVNSIHILTSKFPDLHFSIILSLLAVFHMSLVSPIRSTPQSIYSTCVP